MKQNNDIYQPTLIALMSLLDNLSITTKVSMWILLCYDNTWAHKSDNIGSIQKPTHDAIDHKVRVDIDWYEIPRSPNVYPKHNHDLEPIPASAHDDLWIILPK